MKFISEVTVSIKKEFFSRLIDEIYKRDCKVQNLKLLEDSNLEELYSLEIIYYNRNSFVDFLDILNNSQNRYKVVSVVNSLEEKIIGGLLNVTGKMPLEDMNDYEMFVQGATELIFEKIKGGRGKKFTGISKNIGLIGGVNIDEESKIDRLLNVYSSAEKDSVIINRFSGLNAFPLLIRFDQSEDFIKTIKRIQYTFSAIRLTHLDEADIFIYDQIYSDLNIPVTSYGLDDLPLYLLTVITKIIMKNKLNPGETTIGLVGIDTSALRLTRLLTRIGYLRILGYDNNEKLMLLFENEEGLATTIENIFSNADIIILFKRCFDEEGYQKIRPGLYIISLLKNEEVDMNMISDRGAREFIQKNEINLSIISSGLIRGVIESEILSIDDARLIDLSNGLVSFLSDLYSFPDFFSGIHEKIPELMKKST